MADVKKVPQLRIKGFNGEWEEKRLEDILQTIPFNQYLKSPEVHGKYEIIQQGDNPIVGYANGLPCNDFADTVIFGDHTLSLYRPQKPFFVSTDGVRIIKGINSMYGDYLIYLLEKHKPKSEGYKRYYSILADKSCSTTENNEEQKLIGQLLKNIDDLIAIYKNKHEELLQTKKSMLDKMFPKIGSDIPEVRFKEFSGKWLQLEIGDCFTERVERMPEGELISVTINHGIKKFSEIGRHDNSNDDKSKYKKVCIGDIAYNSMRMWQGASGYSPYEGIVSPAYTVICPKDDMDSRYFSYLFKRPEMIHIFQMNSQGITSDTWNLKFPVFSKILVTVAPSIEEQQKIGKYFEQLDKLISFNQQEIIKLQAIKKALLEKMFI